MTFKRLGEINPSDARAIGSKAYRCASLRQAGLPVPDGFVVLSGAVESAAARKTLDELMESLTAPHGFAVRSSASDEDGAAASFAGIHDTWLNVSTSRVADGIAACRDSIHSSRAQAYRKTLQVVNRKPAGAILVQPMIAPETSGVAFTADPITGDRTSIIIGSSWGLGEAVVGGWVEADQFRVSRTGEFLAESIGDKRCRVAQLEDKREMVEVPEPARRAPSLTRDELTGLVQLLIRIEEIYGSPQDVEWCLAGGKFWILQSRPVTKPGGRADIEWTRANLSELLPEIPPPQVTAYLCEALNRGYQKHFGGLLAPELAPAARAFSGRVYFNLSQLRHLCRMAGVPPARMLRALGHGDVIVAEDQSIGPIAFSKKLRMLPDRIRLLFRHLSIARRVKRSIAEMRAVVTGLESADPASMEPAAILRTVQADERHVADRMDTVLVLGELSAYEPRLRAMCERVDYPFERLMSARLAAGEKSVNAQQGLDLLDLAHWVRSEPVVRAYFLNHEGDFSDYREQLAGTEFVPKFAQFLAQHGHRGFKETDWSRPRHAENPKPLLMTLQTHVRAADCPSLAAIASRQESEWQETWSEFASRAASKGVPIRVAGFLLGRIRQMYLWRELFRSELMRVLSAKRRYHLELARNLSARGWIEKPSDYFLLKLDEITHALNAPGGGEPLRTVVQNRAMEIAAWSQLEMPLVARDSQLKATSFRAERAGGAVAQVLKGLCLSPGFVEGEVIVLSNPDECKLQPGMIIVAQATDPSWSSLFTIAAGVIVEVGGLLSHAATVAREYGLPAVANVRGATKVLSTGMRVRLDATNETVEILL